MQHWQCYTWFFNWFAEYSGKYLIRLCREELSRRLYGKLVKPWLHQPFFITFHAVNYSYPQLKIVIYWKAIEKKSYFDKDIRTFAMIQYIGILYPWISHKWIFNLFSSAWWADFCFHLYIAFLVTHISTAYFYFILFSNLNFARHWSYVLNKYALTK